ncbi:MAG: glycosyltransferase [Chlamydiota bacterium]|nr:glycosyltransferase [Chlamydiota bacterium]
MKRILILYISPNTGHHTAAKSVEQALLKSDGEIEVLIVNALNYISPFFEKIILKTYLSVLKNTPELWEFLYDNNKIKDRISPLRSIVLRQQSQKLFRLINEYHPDVVLCTQAYPCQIIGEYKHECAVPFELMAVITDYVVHAYWVSQRVDHYMMPHQEGLQKMAGYGIDLNRMSITGIPVDPVFNRTLDKTLLKKQMGLPENLPVILIMGGGQCLIPVKDILDGLAKIRMPHRIIVVTGTNKSLFGSMMHYKQKHCPSMHVFAYVHEIDKLMEVSDLLISKPGGLSSSEAMVKDLPMLIYRPLPGQESKNADFLTKNGVALRAEEISEITDKVEMLFKDNVLLKSLKDKILLMKRPDAASDIAKVILHQVPQQPVSAGQSLGSYA